MKFSLIAAVVVLALAQGSFAQDVPELEKLTQYFEEMKTKLTDQVNAIINNPELTSQAHSLLMEKKTQVDPIITQIQEQLKSAVSTAEEQIKPLAENVQANIQPMMEDLQKQLEGIFQKVTEQVRAIGQ